MEAGDSGRVLDFDTSSPQTVTLDGAGARGVLAGLDAPGDGAVHGWFVSELDFLVAGHRLPIGKVTHHLLDMVLKSPSRKAIGRLLGAGHDDLAARGE